MERRRFIGLSTYTALVITLPFTSGCAEGPIDKNISAPTLFKKITGEKSIRETGQDYLKQFPEENSQQKLADLLTGNKEMPSSSNGEQLSEYFDKRIKEDFVDGRIVVVNGWVLSLTEARQCAFFTLLQPSK